MSVKLIQQKLATYHCQTIIDQENALKEIAQEIALMALSRASFFKVAAFQGGTCLRILHGLERFSEDLDFVLETQDKNFEWGMYIKNLTEEFNTYGYTLEVKIKQQLEKSVRTAFLKTTSQGGILILKDTKEKRPKLQIKLEIDTNPPAGSVDEIKYLDFPMPYAIRSQTLPSLFASKAHALLCRDYVKGRDWYDFIWYVSRQIPINFSLLGNAINQHGPWKAKNLFITKEWFLNQLILKINTIDCKSAQQDVARFLKPRELLTLDLWSVEFFLSRVNKLAEYLPQNY